MSKSLDWKNFFREGVGEFDVCRRERMTRKLTLTLMPLFSLSKPLSLFLSDVGEALSLSCSYPALPALSSGEIFLKKFFLSFRRRKNVQLCNWRFFLHRNKIFFSDDWFQNPKSTFSSNNRSCLLNCGIKTQSPWCRRTLGQLCDFWPRPPPPPKKAFFAQNPCGQVSRVVQKK